METREEPGFVVQRVAPVGVPVSVRGVEDPLFGPVVSFGVSGPATELLGDRAYRIPPMTALDAAEMVRDIKAAPLLLGYRGSEPVDIDAVERLLLTRGAAQERPRRRSATSTSPWSSSGSSG